MTAAILNSHWYGLNEIRSYPIDDSATNQADNGQPLPADILADISIKFPNTLGKVCFLSSILVSPKFISLTLMVAQSVAADPATFVPVAVLSLPTPVTPERHYALKPQQPGVGGWVVFGSGVLATASPFRGTFSTPLQSVLAAKAARPYKPIPVSDIGRLYNSTALTGIVRLVGQDPVEIVHATREINGRERDVALIRLVQPVGADNVFQTFSGPCGSRPESGNCGDPQPVEFINTVSPDCNGNISLHFRGCATIAQMLGSCGVVLDCALGLMDTCIQTNQLPDAHGILPNQFIDLCNPPPPEEESAQSVPSETGDSDPAPPISIIDLGDLPFTDDFNDCRNDNFPVREGVWSFVNDDSPLEMASRPANLPSVCDAYSPEYACSNSNPDTCQSSITTNPFGAAFRNVVVWDGWDTFTVPRVVTTDFKMSLGPPGALHNAGVVINYRPHPTQAHKVIFYLALCDLDSLTFSLVHWNGTIFQTLSRVPILDLALDSWYRLIVMTSAGMNGAVTMTIELRGVSTNVISTDVIIGPASVNDYLPATGRFGLYTNRAWSRFSFFHVELGV